MSDLSKPREVIEWVDSWEKHYLPHNPGALRRKLCEARDTMRSAIASCESTGRWPSGWVPDDVRTSARLLTDAAARHS